ncbi:threonine--tRNA ligase [Pigmentibacter ruber]|uniref:threonine--tRNA ligase n=1 Tax=Pigmentibacter ruber TaxID=2683196 RepID=UPI00131E1543|nr:threonine--tRNA ligase [Pigmentibacter ruber]BFD32885.1 threonine--tRNA ligase [Pigmentibacter ruber]
MSSLSIFLPDGSSRSFPASSTVFDVAKSISSGLAKSAIVGKINGKLVDLDHPIHDGDKVEIITDRNPEGLEVIRHSTVHVMAMAIQEVFPGTQITIGPVVENQFYYDIYPKEGVKIGTNEFPLIEKRMQEIVEKNIPFTRRIVSREDAVKHFDGLGEKFKVEIVKDLPADSEIKIYAIANWDDLCRGPHVQSTGKLGHFKLMSVAGAYWRANKDNEQLVRIYGTAWPTKKDLDGYLNMLEEAKKRDHVLLGKQLNLFTLMSDIAPGAAFFFPNGAKIFTLLQNYIRVKWAQFGFQEIQSPQVMNVNLWKVSGHYEKYRDDMYIFKDDHDDEFGIKPMSCPGHVRMFMVGQKSYRDLPLRYGEFGVVHRNELSGTLHGLTRVRRITQDDGHIFCMLSQVQSEIMSALQFVKEVYADLGFNEVIYMLSTRPENRIGSDEIWDTAENALEEALKKSNVNYQVNPGDGAFYGPKIDFKVKDAIGRMHQCATIQLDFQMPARFGISYQAANNTQETPVMVHRAVLGSVERFMGIFIEHCAGHFPVGLAPVQCRVVTVTEAQDSYAHKVTNFLKANGIRVETDFSNDKLGAKIRDAQLLKIPYMLVIGDKEVQTNTLTARYRDGKNLAPMSPEDFLTFIKNESGIFWGLDTNQR